METPPAPTPRNRQTSCLHTTKATNAPRQGPQGLQRTRRQPPSPEAGLPARRSAAEPHLHWGSPSVRAAPRARPERRLWPRLSVASPQRTPGTRGSVPPTCSAASSLLLWRAVDRYFIVCAAHPRDLGTQLGRQPCNSVLRCSFPSGCLPLPPPLCPSSCSARELHSPSPELAGQLAPAASPGPGLHVTPAAVRPRFGAHLQLCPGPPSSFGPSVLPPSSRCQPRLWSPLSLAAPARRLSGGWGGRCQ